MLREARKDESVRGSGWKVEGPPGGVLEIESSPLPLYWKIPGSRCRLVENSSVHDGEMRRNRQRPRDQLLLVIRCPSKFATNVRLCRGYFAGAEPGPSRVKEKCSHKRMCIHENRNTRNVLERVICFIPVRELDLQNSVGIRSYLRKTVLWRKHSKKFANQNEIPPVHLHNTRGDCSLYH